MNYLIFPTGLYRSAGTGKHFTCSGSEAFSQEERDHIYFYWEKELRKGARHGRLLSLFVCIRVRKSMFDLRWLEGKKNPDASVGIPKTTIS